MPVRGRRCNPDKRNKKALKGAKVESLDMLAIRWKCIISDVTQAMSRAGSSLTAMTPHG